VHIPEGAASKPKYDWADPNRRKLEKDIEQENGGAGVYNVDLKKLYQLKNPEWKYDNIPEIMDGKNVADFIDPDIEAKLEALEREEERLIAEGFYEDADEDMDDESDEELLEQAAKEVEQRKAEIVYDSRMKKGKNKAIMSNKFKARVCIWMSTSKRYNQFF
jgi:nucleolar GTP-binding protein